MKIELWINGFLHDEMERTWSKEKLVKAMKDKWWYLLARSDWKILIPKESKMNEMGFAPSEYTCIVTIEKVPPVKAA